MAGFRHEAVLDWDKYSCDTIRENQRRRLRLVSDWPLHEIDVRKFDFSTLASDVDLVAGGPPCQPFSIGGKARGMGDERNMFPEVFRAIRELRPRAVLLENVKGLTRRSFATYFGYLTLQLRHPEIIRKSGETWVTHLSRLERHHTVGKRDGLHYNVVWRLLNAADFGVPQRRERVIIVGIRSDLGLEWSFPEPTHSQDGLLREQWITGSYWDRHRVSKKDRPSLSGHLRARIARLGATGDLWPLQSWRTVRDAIADLPDPKERNGDDVISNHRFQPGSRPYPGHTGSPFDEPAKTLKAGDHGVPGGENMLAYPDGTTRYFTVRESARLQSFPDEFVFHGSWTETMRQLGNAVPVTLARVVAEQIHQLLSRHSRRVAG
jgi:DNA (cytosine-5)-methyltransferase 1